MCMYVCTYVCMHVCVYRVRECVRVCMRYDDLCVAELRGQRIRTTRRAMLDSDTRIDIRTSI